MNKFSREIQLIILQEAVKSYPLPTEACNFKDKGIFTDAESSIANIHYLFEHGLLETRYGEIHYDLNLLLNSLKATKDGVDFLLGDEGLSAILKVTSVRFHNEAFQQIADFINQNAPDSPDKKKFLSQLRELPYETTKHIALELVSKGLNQTPNVIQWLQTLIHHS
ncbi:MULTISPECIES: hypothetical protein [Yersinia]|uniref:hypothetical protein n=1 Tax=Yersinia TaxID=629 RepID=UPI0005E57444|nr:MULTISPECIES: hypothetical protein [Yersinia]CNL08682.1 Uncharacterised protein [Yersinia frederiksenii]CNL29170.1 Uncharacterised protein [Yersinia enterocolitica]